jgi:competence protein ComGC
VTIKTSSGTTEYKVDSNSDIDKNGEAALKDLVVGDAVTFSVDSTSTTTIDKLHAGNEALNKPTAAPTGTTTG